MPLSTDAALKVLRKRDVRFMPVKGEWILQNLSLSSAELVKVAKILQTRLATSDRSNQMCPPPSS